MLQTIEFFSFFPGSEESKLEQISWSYALPLAGPHTTVSVKQWRELKHWHQAENIMHYILSFLDPITPQKWVATSFILTPVSKKDAIHMLYTYKQISKLHSTAIFHTTSAALVAVTTALNCDRWLFCWTVWSVWHDGIKWRWERAFPPHDNVSPYKTVLQNVLAWKKFALVGRKGTAMTLCKAIRRQFDKYTVPPDSWKHNESSNYK